MCARHVKRAIEEFNIKLPKRLEEKEEKKAVLQYNCQVHVYITVNLNVSYTSQVKSALTSPLGSPGHSNPSPPPPPPLGKKPVVMHHQRSISGDQNALIPGRITRLLF